ncbi:MAG TPA: hypothetical protein VLI39_16040 [Sedimentisphaerales bacterium]|nr:hypothetical protein [Sedimentisphaerales bacterium]
MASEAQILANRLNAQKSTGPRTAEGKAAVSQNAVKHGLTARSVVVSGEDPGQFEFYRERMLDELEPVGEVEFSLAERIVGLSWRLKRAEKLQAAAFDSLYAQEGRLSSETPGESQDADGDSILGRALARDFADDRVLERMLMYERRIEQSLYRTMAELKKHRILAEIGPGKMWELRRALASGNDAKRDDVGNRTEAEGGQSVCSAPVRAYPQSREDKITPDGVTTNEDRRTPPAAESLPASPFTPPDLSCETNPIPPSAGDGQVPFEKGFAADPPCDRPWETNPMGPQDQGRDAAIEPSPFAPATSPSPLQTWPCTPPPPRYNRLILNEVGSGVSSLR